jgi:hypothetical protein
MVRIPHVTVMVVVAAGIGAADIVRLTQQPQILPVQQWRPAPRPAPEISEGRAWLDRKAAERERAFQQQQRQQAEERRDLRLERRLEADRRIERDWQGWPGR